MKITQFETLESSPYSNVPWVQVHTDDGLVGSGETFFVPATVATYIREADGQHTSLAQLDQGLTPFRQSSLGLRIRLLPDFARCPDATLRVSETRGRDGARNPRGRYGDAA